VSTLAHEHDCLLLDLDGTVFRGHEPTSGAVETLAAVDARILFVTNNASRGPDEVAEHLCAMGFTAKPDDVVTSAQSAARLLKEQLQPGAAVLIVGTDSLAAEVRNLGLKPVRLWSDGPAAVVQGHSPQTGWPDLAEAALAIRGGALWVAANVDKTLPSERGLLPGNGAMVAALRAATDGEPQVAGKPQPTLLADALARGKFRTPLVVGDRLDTDIEGAVRAGSDSLLVLTGVSDAVQLLAAAPAMRPTYLARDLDGLNVAHPEVRVTGPTANCLGWVATRHDHSIDLHRPAGDNDPINGLRALVTVAWHQPGADRQVRGDRDVLAALGLPVGD
jgi:glycerol-1-phosphatase